MPRLGQPGSSNVNVRGVDLTSLSLRPAIKITEGRAFTPGTDEVIIGRRIGRRFANCRVGDRIQLSSGRSQSSGTSRAAAPPSNRNLGWRRSPGPRLIATTPSRA
jgi:ABC-type lipoprotein release transport system permease subunit